MLKEWEVRWTGWKNILLQFSNIYKDNFLFFQSDMKKLQINHRKTRKLTVLTFVSLDGVMQAHGGKGKRLFGDGTIPAAFKLIESKMSPGGVIVASYKRDGGSQARFILDA